jgi:hypothetical protein
MENIYLIGYFGPSDGRFNLSDSTATLDEAKIRLAFQYKRYPNLDNRLFEGRDISPDTESLAEAADRLGKF